MYMYLSTVTPGITENSANWPHRTFCKSRMVGIPVGSVHCTSSIVHLGRPPKHGRPGAWLGLASLVGINRRPHGIREGVRPRRHPESAFPRSYVYCLPLLSIYSPALSCTVLYGDEASAY